MTPASLHILNREPSVLDQYLMQLRDTGIHNDRMRFRTNLARIGTLMAYEISRVLQYQKTKITTPLATTEVYTIADDLVIATILRAGMPFMQGFLQAFDAADAAFVGAMRGKHKADHSFDIELDYVACPDLNNKTLIICDPMLASGKSLVEACHSLLEKGKPRHIHLAHVIASPGGVEYVRTHLPDATLWIAALDERLNDDAYIVPGLGDAGDLAFGEKI